MKERVEEAEDLDTSNIVKDRKSVLSSHREPQEFEASHQLSRSTGVPDAPAALLPCLAHILARL